MVGIRAGVWEGSYKYANGKQANTSATLLFVTVSFSVVGRGQDEAGPFDISGTYARDNSFTWNKVYSGKSPHTDIYTGKFNTDASIEGNWKQSNNAEPGGSFKLSPKVEDAPELSADWISILIDQMQRAGRGEPSVFSLDEEKNLVWKNLSIQEIKVILGNISVPQYPDVLRIYYQTYRVAIQIADDSERNAVRHAFWQIALVNKFGAGTADKLGQAHEVGRPGTTEDNRVDELNNKVAQQYAFTHPGSDPLQAANMLWATKKLHGYSDHVAHPHDEL